MENSNIQTEQRQSRKFRLKTRRKIWMLYLVGLASFSGVFLAGILNLHMMPLHTRIGIFIYALGTTVILSKNMVDIYIGAGSVKQNLQDIFITMLGFSFLFASGVMAYLIF